MITYIKINGFKSFHNFEMEFTPLTVIAGMNASGKSNLFDALSLLSRLTETPLNVAFKEQRGNPIELFTLYDGEYASEIEFVVEVSLDNKLKNDWGEELNLTFKKFRYELKINRVINKLGLEDLAVSYEKLIQIDSLKKQVRPFIKTKKSGDFINITCLDIEEDREGPAKITRKLPLENNGLTTLRGIPHFELPHIYAVKKEIQSWKFLHLNPKDLREPTLIQPGVQDLITSSGKNLAAALYRISLQDKFNLTEISRKLNNFIPHLTKVIIKKDEANQQITISIKDDNDKEFSSRLLSEGTLRLLALCILEVDEEHKGLLCFEEPENGIHPFRIKAMAELLRDLSTNVSGLPLRQVIVNTHSPTLVGECIKWKENNNISVGLSFLKTTITDIEDKRVTLRTTSVEFANGKTKTKEEKNLHKFTMHQIKEYLETADTENALSVLLNE